MKKTWKEKRMKSKRWNDVEECPPRDYNSQHACRPQPNRLLLLLFLFVYYCHYYYYYYYCYARIGLLEADLMQVHSPQSHLTQIIIRHHSDGAATTTTINTTARVEPTPWAEVATRGSAITTTRVAPTPWAHEPH